jgi:hypothetical protein
MMDSPPDTSGAIMSAAELEAEANRNAAQEELSANRPNQQGPQSSTEWTNRQVDANTGVPIVQLRDGTWVPQTWFEENGGYVDVPDTNQTQPGGGSIMDQIRGGNLDTGGGSADRAVLTGHVAGDRVNDSDAAYRRLHDQRNNPGGGGTIIYNGIDMDPVTQWNQETTLNPEWQASLDSARGLMDSQMAYRGVIQDEWGAAGPDYGGGLGGGSIKPGITVDQAGGLAYGQNQANMGAQDWRQFGTTGQTVGANDYNQFGTTGQTIGADDYLKYGSTESQIGGDDWRQFGTSEAQINGDDWRQFGNTENTIGADDWQQYGNTEQTLGAGEWDARFGQGQDHQYGDHDQGAADWNQIEYTPDAIRRQAESETMAYMNSQLDPQWDRKQEALEVQLANQGLQWGDAAYDNAMESMKNSRSTAYGGARNQALADSRAEANMLWGQEMQRSEQKNMQTQADLDNTYRARQANIGNYQTGRGQDMEGYLAYQREAFGQDLSSRQQTLDSSLNFGREAYGQDLASRQQQLDANLDYGREGFQQDLQGRQQQINANLDYGREGFQQDLQGRQQQMDAGLSYGREAFGQDLSSRQQQLDADLGYGREAFGQDLASRQQRLDANRNYSNDAFNQDLQARQANISNYLNIGRESFNQDLQGNQLNLDAMTEAERAQQMRYQLVNPNETSGAINAALGG